MWYVCRCPKFKILNLVLNNVIENRLIYKSRNIKYSTQTYQAQTKSRPRTLVLGLIGIGVGVVAGSTYSYYKLLEYRPIPNDSKETIPSVVKSLPNVPITRMFVSPTDTTGLDLTLYQYPTCPFCCKVRAFLDYYGISYKVIEVDPVLRQQIKWSSYRKVPILLVKVDDGYQQLNDSSAIVSILGSYLKDQNAGIKELVQYYPTIEYHDDDGHRKKEIMNKYFLMYQMDVSDEKLEEIRSVQKWRKWADDVLVHSLSPNVYRTKDEAVESFRWFSKVGEWDKIFPAWEVSLIVYVGAFAMWIIGKRLKTKYGLKDDVRISLYDDCNRWMKELRKKGTSYHGGSSPDLADLAVYGVLSSIEGCEAFQDALKNTKIGIWYNGMRNLLEQNKGKLVSNLALV